MLFVNVTPEIVNVTPEIPECLKIFADDTKVKVYNDTYLLIQ